MIKNLQYFRNDAILKWLKNNRRTLSSTQESKFGSKQVLKYFHITQLLKWYSDIFFARVSLVTDLVWKMELKLL